MTKHLEDTVHTLPEYPVSLPKNDFLAFSNVFHFSRYPKWIWKMLVQSDEQRFVKTENRFPALLSFLVLTPRNLGRFWSKAWVWACVLGPKEQERKLVWSEFTCTIARLVRHSRVFTICACCSMRAVSFEYVARRWTHRPKFSIWRFAVANYYTNPVWRRMTVDPSMASTTMIPWTWSTHHSIWSVNAFSQSKCESYHKPSSKSRLFRCVSCLQRFAHVLSRSRYFDLIRWSLALYLLTDVAMNVLLLLFFPEVLRPLTPRLAAFWPTIARLTANPTLLPSLLAAFLVLDLLGLLSLLLLSVPLALINMCHLSFALLKLAAAFESCAVLAAHTYFLVLAVLFAVLLPHRPYPPV